MARRWSLRPSVAAALLALCGLDLVAAAAVPYAQYIYAPSSRTVYPAAVYEVNGTVVDAPSLTQPRGHAVFHGASAVTFDFHKDVGGLVSVTVGAGASPRAALGLTFTESSQWISGTRSDSTFPGAIDDIIWLAVDRGAGTYTVDKKHVRGGFRYLSLVSNASAAVIPVESVRVAITSAPAQADLRAYTGYFHCNDELLNRIWYAGAYTCQVATVDPTTGDAFLGKPNPIPQPAGQLPLNEWFFNTTITNGTSALTDGGKRDRVVFSGDFEVSIPTVAVSTFDLYSVRTAVDSLFSLQLPNGRLPYAGIPLPTSLDSWTYHLHDLIAVYNYYIYTGDAQFLQTYWEPFKRGIQWSLLSIDSTGLMEVGSPNDWLRYGMGGHNIEANAILYYALNRGLELAAVMHDASVVQNWTRTAAKVKSATYELLWDAGASLYKDNETTTLHPQDGNVWAIKANLTHSAAQASAISQALHARWGPYGAPAPEAGPTVSPYISGLELEAHYLVAAPQVALDLMRRQWGFMLNDPRMTNSTFIEGYSTDGSLHYAIITSDQTVSHAHGWSTAPTSLLTFYAAGIHLVAAEGRSWAIAPQMGDLTDVDAGFSTPLGAFASTVRAEHGAVCALHFCTPKDSEGSVSLPGVRGKLCSTSGKEVALDRNGYACGLQGGCWTLELD